MLKKVVTIGPESTGKSSLCEQLAKHYNTSWCPEYAREYLTIHGMQYTYEDLLTIANGQVELEEKYIQWVMSNGQSANTHTGDLHSPLFIDTDMYVMKVWCEFVFGTCHQFILDQIATRKYDLYLLCDIDLPWTRDELREYPDEGPRQKLYEIYKDTMQNQSTPWVEINGSYEERLQKALVAVERILKE